MRTLLALLAAACVAACGAQAQPAAEAGPPQERFPTPEDFPPGVMETGTFTAPAPEGWRLSYLKTGPRERLDWRIVVISGTPSWPEYWAPTIAALPADVEMVVVARPGFSTSEPREAVPDLQAQADAMAPILETPDNRPILLVGQSFGAPIAALMAAQHQDRVRGLVLVSSYFGVRGRTARRLLLAGGVLRPLLPRDLRNSIVEVRGQERQLPQSWAALEALRMPVAFVHGDEDSFVPAASAQGFAETYGAEYIPVPGGDHFLNACCVPALVEAFARTMARADGAACPGPAPGEGARLAAP